jgi:hypothetical protein
VLATCRPAFDVGQPRLGWTLYADNPSIGIDYVIRFTSSEEPAYLLVEAGREGFVQVADEAPAGAALAILDPVSCRVVADVAPVPEGHPWVTIAVDGMPQVGETPDDYGDPLDPAEWLSHTDLCAASDPSATARPTPSLVAGDWLEGGAMYCEAAGDVSDPSASPSGRHQPFGVRGEFLVGAVAGCEAHRGDIGQATIDAPDGVVIWNPDGNLGTLGVAWEETACTDGATVSLLPTTSGYRVHVISIGSPCEPGMKPYAAVFFLTEPIDADQVAGDLERVGD